MRNFVTSNAKFCFPPAPKPRDAALPAPRGDRPRERSIESICGTLSGVAFGLKSGARQTPTHGTCRVQNLDIQEAGRVEAHGGAAKRTGQDGTPTEQFA